MVKGIYRILNKKKGKPCSCAEWKLCDGCKKKRQAINKRKPQVVVESSKPLPVPIKISKHRGKSPKEFKFPKYYKAKQTWKPKQTKDENPKVKSKGKFCKWYKSVKESKAHGDSNEDKRATKEEKKAAKQNKKAAEDYAKWKREEEKIKQELALEKAQREKEAELLDQFKRQQREQEKALIEREAQLLVQLKKQQKEQEKAEKAEKERHAILEQMIKEEADKAKLYNSDTMTKEQTKPEKTIKSKKKFKEEPPPKYVVAEESVSEIIKPAKKIMYEKPKKVKPSKKVDKEEVRYKTIKRAPIKTRLANCFYRFCCEFYCWMTIILLLGLLVILLI